MKIGLDLDHTIINYQNAFKQAAISWQLVADDFEGDKNTLKQSIIEKHSHEAWMRLQGHVYGKGIQYAQLMPGVDDFIQKAHQQNIPIVIISHKTLHGHFDDDKIDLRKAALNWLEQHQIFDNTLTGLSPQCVFFRSTRDEKIAQIQAEGCTHFVDDLPEVLTDKHFPDITKYLYSPSSPEVYHSEENYIVMPSWQILTDHLFS